MVYANRHNMLMVPKSTYHPPIVEKLKGLICIGGGNPYLVKMTPTKLSLAGEGGV